MAGKNKIMQAVVSFAGTIDPPSGRRWTTSRDTSTK